LWVAICAYLIVAYTKHLMRSPLSIYEISQVLSTSLFDKTLIRDLINEYEPQIKQNQNVKELLLF
jgi:hypothetical protein